MADDRSGNLSDFLSRVEPYLSKILNRNLRSHAFDGMIKPTLCPFLPSVYLLHHVPFYIQIHFPHYTLYCNHLHFCEVEPHLNPVHGEVYSIQHYVIKFVSYLRQFSGFLHVFQFPPPIKLTAMI